MVAPGAGFCGGTLYRPKIGEDQTKGLSCKTSWFSVRKYVMTKKRSSPTNQWDFGLKRKKNKWCHLKMVTLWAGRPPPPPLATPLTMCF